MIGGLGLDGRVNRAGGTALVRLKEGKRKRERRNRGVAPKLPAERRS